MTALHFLTIQQPWAWAIAEAGKRVENRTWPTSYRGPIAIHAGKTDDAGAYAITAIQTALRATTFDVPPPGLTRGAIVAVAQLTGCHRARPSDPTCCQPWGMEEQFHFELAEVRPLTEPVPMRGMLGLRPVADDVAALVAERVA